MSHDNQQRPTAPHQLIYDLDNDRLHIRFNGSGFWYHTNAALEIAEAANRSGGLYDVQAISTKAFRQPLVMLEGRPC